MRSCATIQGNDEDLNWAFHNLGTLYSDQGKLQEAKEMYLRALQRKEKALPHNVNATNVVKVEHHFWENGVYGSSMQAKLD